MKEREKENAILEKLCQNTLQKYKKLIISQIITHNINISEFSQKDQEWIRNGFKNIHSLHNFTEFKPTYKRPKFSTL